MKKKGIEEVLERISNMTYEEKVEALKEAKVAGKDIAELADLIISSVAAWLKHHADDEYSMPKLMSGMSRGVCFILAAVDSINGEPDHKPSDMFRALLPMGIKRAEIEREMHDKMEHDQMVEEGVN